VLLRRLAFQQFLMQTTSRPRYADWKAPAEDGQVLLWPEPDELLRDTEQNHQRLSSANTVLVQGVPLPEVRHRMRAWIGHREQDRPLLAMAHQTELYHAGVWAKNALMNAVAAKLGGIAYQFAVDTDEPKHLKLKWPGGSVALTDDDRPAEWIGLLAAPSPAHLARVAEMFERAASQWNFHSLVPDFLASLRRLALDLPNLPTALTDALHELDWSLGLRHHAMLFSPVCQAEPYLLFAWHALSRADAFAADYNAALEQYRREHRIRTPGRPMPNLKVSADECEVPFWLDSQATGTRTRASVVRLGDRWAVRAPGGADLALQPQAAAADASAQLSSWLRHHNLRLSPRAVTLTTVLRLLVADLFIHGIGGARYDQVTDQLIARHFGLEPPRFAVTTATIYFPQAVGRSRVCMSCVFQDGHRLRHRILGGEKDQLVAAIEAAPRRSLQRSGLFHDMHNRLAAASDHPAIRRWEQEREAAERHEQEEKELFDRELFYAIQPRERLGHVIDSYRARFSA
jgi:hypothetical protein